MARRSTRRRFLRSLGTAGVTVTLAGCTAYAGEDDPVQAETGTATRIRTATTTDTATPTETDTPTPDEGDGADGRPDDREPPENGAVVFVYDDGRMADYTKALPVHREFDAPATTGIVSGYVGRKYYMDVEQIEALAEAGWEIASHTVSHTAVDSAALVVDVDPDDACVYPEHVRHGHHEGNVLEITDGDRSVRRTIAGLARDDEDTRYVELEEPPGEAFQAGETAVRYPPEFVEESLAKSRRDLEALGFSVDSFLAPYDKFDEYSMEFVPRYYEYVLNARHGSAVNRPGSFDPYRTRRDYYIEFTSPKYVKRHLDEVADIGGLGVFGAHPAVEAVTGERIRAMLKWVEARDIEVMTMREACRCFGSDD